MKPTLRAGFVPLVDAAPLIVAAEKGFARAEGFELDLIRQPSWASLRDHLNLGHFDCAQALAPLPIAAALGVGQVQADLIAPFVLSRGGNAITLSRQLADEIRESSGGENPGEAREWARALAIRLRQRKAPITLAMVYPFSGHNFEIRYWLASAGIHPDRDLRLVAIPPQLMVESMRAGQIDGFCVGAPWSGLAVAEGAGEIVATKADIFPHGIEKVLAMRTELLDDDPSVSALLQALSAAAQWCDLPENHEELAGLLARREYLDIDPELNLIALGGRLTPNPAEPDPDQLYFWRHDANRPRRIEALWIYAQMRRWGQVPADPVAEQRAARVYREDVYARLIERSGPEAGDAIAACDGIDFDGASVGSYLELQSVATPYGSVIGDL